MAGFDGEAFCPVDMYETDNEVVVRAALPGVKPDDVEVTITGETLTIKGESKQEEQEKKANYFRQAGTNFARTTPSSMVGPTTHVRSNVMRTYSGPATRPRRSCYAWGMIEGRRTRRSVRPLILTIRSAPLAFSCQPFAPTVLQVSRSCIYVGIYDESQRRRSSLTPNVVAKDRGKNV
jgi:hypothetical protein